ncbi:MAG: hypothetical protein WB660_30580 [Candidatus Sulfotelmatobacter sp.]
MNTTFKNATFQKMAAILGMRTIYCRFGSYMAALALVLAIVPGALAQCGISIKPIKPSAWRPDYAEAQQRLVLADWHDGHEASIVGMWHVILKAETMNGAPFSEVIDNAVAVWHSDGTEIINSSRPAQDGDFCLGVWIRTGRLSYFLNHIPWQGNDTENPGGIGNPQGGGQLTENVNLSPDGNSYSGHFTLDAYDISGKLSVSFTGRVKAKRITTSTSFGDIFKQQ